MDGYGFIQEYETKRKEYYSSDNLVFKMGGYFPQVKPLKDEERDRLVFLNIGSRSKLFCEKTKWEVGKPSFFEAHRNLKIEKQKWSTWSPCIFAISEGKSFCHICYGMDEVKITENYAFPVYSFGRKGYGYFLFNIYQLGQFADFIKEKKDVVGDDWASFISLSSSRNAKGGMDYNLDFYKPMDEEISKVYDEENFKGLQKFYFLSGLRKYAEKCAQTTTEYNYLKLHKMALDDLSMKDKKMDAVVNSVNELVGIPQSEEEKALSKSNNGNTQNGQSSEAQPTTTPASQPVERKSPPVDSDDPFAENEDEDVPF